MKDPGTPFRIGVDGGASKTACVLVDAGGAVVAEHEAPGCNPSHEGPERARQILVGALETLLATAGSPRRKVASTLLCMAGNQAYWHETAASLEAEFGAVTIAPDSLAVLELATGGTSGLAVHAGTGSFVTARAPDGTFHYSGGLGWRFGDAASGYDLGRRGIARALLELQGSAGAPRPGGLAAALRDYTGLGTYVEVSRLLYSADDAGQKIAAFAPRVIDLAGQGCHAARQVIIEGVNELAGLVDSMIEKHFWRAMADAPVVCGVSGAILNRPPCHEALRAVAAARAWPVRLEPITASPIEGVRRLLVRQHPL